ncbi:hypothetical protein JRO89_XS07G0046400 [Xanthoceras sorbifolium]|uniref:J domain-containing protein required for chloroplast accumulation response 1 n=1 Tax=Xanthoceras sorbifolium TaxID=99658 RepID=A0ABQ8HSR0_9ROSI|nr:hypothetical protein JRO89_XS07G0046400 [Xanthoceras sorbifolium]
MERFSQRESVLLGYSPQRSFINDNSSPKTPYRNSDVDFNDVFGGPPRRSSIHNHEMHYSCSEATDDSGHTEDDETVVSRNSWNGLSEKPVFGEEGLNRRRYPKENFFNDIFRGSESLSSSLRKRDWDPYASSPGSRVLSPARPLPPKAEPFGTSVPAQFSLPAKLTKGMDLPTFGSPPRSPYKSKDGASNGLNYYSHSRSKSSSLSQSQEERNDTMPTYRQSLLSREFSLSSKESSNLIGYDETVTGGNSKEESNCSGDVTSGNQFHFSIYKWASKGVPLVIPPRGGSNLRLKESDDTEKSSSSGGRIEGESLARELSTATLNDTKLPSNDRESAAINKFPTIEQDKQDNGSLPDIINRDKVKPRQIIVDPGKTSWQSAGEEATSHFLSKIGSSDKLKKNISLIAEEAPNPELKPLCSLFYDNDLEQGNKETTNEASGKESKVKSTKKSSVVLDFRRNTKKQDGKETTNDTSRAGNVSLQASPRKSWDSGKTRVKGKVKEFVKIFNQEALSKPKIDSQSQSFRWKEKDTSKPEKEAKFSKIGTDTKTHLSDRHDEKSLSDAAFVVDEHLQCSDKQQHFATKNANHISNGTPQKKDSSGTESVRNGSEAVVGDVDETLQANFQVKELTQEENKMTKASNDPEEIQDIDAKIRQWSYGKEGNIRSLLSTLQYVLWPGSGWKPVPLVEIIEANAVKRSYQKALLCLHPDKLQQKGAASHQKYIAEKVFDILQNGASSEIINPKQ